MNNEQPTLIELFQKHGSDKHGGHHNYGRKYETLFSELRNKPIVMVEIGIGSVNPCIPSSMNNVGYKPGASLRAWRDYFSNGMIYGCDIDRDILFEEERIKTFYFDQTRPPYVLPIPENSCDIIVDDGLHYFSYNWQVFTQLYRYLKTGGIYIIEDVSVAHYIGSDPFTKTHKFDWEILGLYNHQNQDDNTLVIIRKLD